MKKYFIAAAGIMLLSAACQTQKPQKPQSSNGYQTGLRQEEQNQKSPQSGAREKTMKIKVFGIALEDNGKSGEKVGCGDSVVSIEREIKQTDAPLKAALEELLSLKDFYIGQSGLYNSLDDSNLTVQSVNLADGKAVIKLAGILSLGGICDDPRAIAQITKTVLQFPSVKSAEVFINNSPLSEYFSGKGPTIKVKVFFAPKNSQQLQCNDVAAAEREISKTVKVATAALEELLKGPTQDEKQKGLFSQIPAGSKLNSLAIVNGEARADFNQTTQMGGGSCGQGIVTEQIRQTLLQFPTVKSVKLSIDGQTEGIFQP